TPAAIPTACGTPLRNCRRQSTVSAPQVAPAGRRPNAAGLAPPDQRVRPASRATQPAAPGRSQFVGCRLRARSVVGHNVDVGADQPGGLLDETGDVHVPGAGSVHHEASVRAQTRLFELVAERESPKLVTMCDQLVE